MCLIYQHWTKKCSDFSKCENLQCKAIWIYKLSHSQLELKLLNLKSHHFDQVFLFFLLQLKTSIVRQKEPGTPNWFGLEVMGALLPHHVHGLTRLFSHTQSDFTVTFNSHDPTAPLNSIKSAAEGVTNSCDHQGAAESLTTSGIQACHAAAIVEPSPLGKFAIKDSTCQKGQFTWTLWHTTRLYISLVYGAL